MGGFGLPRRKLTNRPISRPHKSYLRLAMLGACRHQNIGLESWPAGCRGHRRAAGGCTEWRSGEAGRSRQQAHDGAGLWPRPARSGTACGSAPRRLSQRERRL